MSEVDVALTMTPLFDKGLAEHELYENRKVHRYREQLNSCIRTHHNSSSSGINTL